MFSTLVLLFVIARAQAGPPVSRSRKDIETFKSFLDKSRQDDGIRLESRMLANPKASPWENSGKYQGDILLNEQQAESLLQQYVEGRNAWILPNTKWPQNIIVYEFENEFDPSQINAIHAAMDEISARTCISFRPRQWWDHNFVRISGRGDGCYANVGYMEGGGIHNMNLALNTPGRGCFIHTIIIHELFHVIGFLHMQSTYNRDNFVRIFWENMEPGTAHNFDRYTIFFVDNLNLPYEYSSVMHYDRWAFTGNGQPTMLPIWEDNDLMGQQQFVTNRDWLRANRHYNCPGAWSSKGNPDEIQREVSV